MASKALISGIAVIAFGSVIGLTATNPTVEEYEAFAIQQARDYLKADICPQKLPLVGTSLAKECKQFLDSEEAKPALQGIISKGTKRQNFVLFSLYRTELTIDRVFPLIPSGILPAYEIKSVGLLRSLHIYGAETL